MSSLKRGTLFLFTGWAIQLIAGYKLKIWLATDLGPEGYGQYGVVMSILLWIEMGAINGLATATQKFVADDPINAKSVIISITKIQFIVNLFLFALCFFGASFISRLFADSEIKGLLQLAILDIWVYSLYFLLFSLLNGLHQFGKQATVISFYAVSKLVFAVLLVTWLHSVTGALIANIVASVFGFLLGIIFSWKILLSKPDHVFTVRPLIQFAFPVALNVLTMQLLFSIDLWFVKYYWGSDNAGFYSAASDISRVPYFMFFALSSVVMPVLTSALKNKDHRIITQTVRNAVRFMVVLIIPVSALIYIYSHEIVVLIFRNQYVFSGSILRVLIWGISFFAFYYLLTTMINADGKPRISLFVTLAAVAADIALNAWLVPNRGPVGGAIATSIALFIATSLAGYIVYNRFKVLISIRSVIKIMAATLTISLIAVKFPVKGYAILPAGIGLFGLYILMLHLFKEIKISELKIMSQNN